MATASGSKYRAPSKLPNTSIWFDGSRSRYFLVPDDATLASGDFKIQTASGRTRQVDESGLRTMEATREEAEQWLRRHLDPAVESLRGVAELAVEKLRDATEKLRAENRATLAGQQPTVDVARDAMKQLVDEWKKLGQQLGEKPSGGPPDRSEILRAAAERLADLSAELRRKAEAAAKDEQLNADG